MKNQIIMNMQVDFKFSHIKLDQFATFNRTTDQPPFAFQTSGEIQTGFNYEAKTIIITVSSDVKLEEKLLMTIKVSSFFEISPSSWDGMKQDGFVVIPKDFLCHIGGLAVSTTRGILFAKTEGTGLNSYIMPLVYLDQLIHSDMKIPDQG